MAAAELRGERDRDGAADVAVREVVDVVVLGDDEALERARRRPVDAAVQLEDHRAALERELGRVRVRQVDPCTRSRRAGRGRSGRGSGPTRCTRRRRTPPPRRGTPARARGRSSSSPAACAERRAPAATAAAARRTGAPASAPHRRRASRAARRRAGPTPSSARRTARRGSGSAASSDGYSNRSASCAARSATFVPSTATSRPAVRTAATCSTCSSGEASAAAGLSPASWRRIDACSCCSCGPGSSPSSSTSARRASWYAASASACRPDRYSASISWPRSRSRSGLLRHERLEPRHQLRVGAARELRVDQILRRRKAKLLQPEHLGLRERLERQLGKRLAAPERERLPQRPHPLLRLTAGRLLHEPLEPVQVDPLPVDLEPVPRRPRDEQVGAQQLPQRGDQILERGRSPYAEPSHPRAPRSGSPSRRPRPHAAAARRAPHAASSRPEATARRRRRPPPAVRESESPASTARFGSCEGWTPVPKPSVRRGRQLRHREIPHPPTGAAILSAGICDL